MLGDAYEDNSSVHSSVLHQKQLQLQTVCSRSANFFLSILNTAVQLIIDLLYLLTGITDLIKVIKEDMKKLDDIKKTLVSPSPNVS